MISKEELLEYMWRNSYKPLTAKELAQSLKIEGQDVFLDLLRELEEEGKIVLNRKKCYGLPQKMNLVVGRLQGKPRGFAFLIPDDAQEQDVYVGAGNLQGAMHNDRVIVRLYRHLSGERRREGEVIRVLKRANERIVGTYESSRHYAFVVPDDQRLGCDIFIPKNEQGKARTGDKVVLEVTSWPAPRRNPEGRIIEVLGRKGEPGIDILSIVRKYQLPETFPAKVLAEAKRVESKVTEEEKKGRRDLRHLPLVTIDGEEAKDLDDAVSLTLLPSGNFYLGVHIADVGHYVPEGSFLDQEALQRGTSVYLVDRVIPMLPPQLSNGICSLNAGEERLALSCLMEIDVAGNVLGHELVPSVIQVKERMTYTAVKQILVEKKAQLRQQYREYVPLLELMQDLCLILRQKRLKRGALDFSFPECRVILDEQGKPIELRPEEHSLAEMLIEEFMIVTNETVSRAFLRKKIPFLYRVHEKPDVDDLKELNEFLGVLGYHLKTDRQGNATPRTFQQVLKKVKGRPEEKLISLVMLRAMKHAYYSPEALGHFGLSAKYYSHFTAPIRRYPDLVIHRIIGEAGQKTITEKRSKKLLSLMEKYAEQSSVRERIAEEAERESVDLKKVEYMRDFVGQVFTGTISGVTSFGFFVELPNTVEGLVHVSTLSDDYYQYVEKKLMLLGENTKKVYRLGDVVKVVLVKVNVEERLLDFEVVAVEKKKKNKPKKRS